MPESMEQGAAATRRRSHLVLAVMLALTLAYALRLSAGDRGVVDWVAIGVIGGGMVWQLGRLGVRLYAVGGWPATGHEGRTLAFWSVGVMNTVLAVPGTEWTWRWWVGVVLLALAAVDTVVLYRKERRMLGGPEAV
jgi:hypothetical protein